MGGAPKPKYTIPCPNVKRREVGDQNNKRETSTTRCAYPLPKERGYQNEPGKDSCYFNTSFRRSGGGENRLSYHPSGEKNRPKGARLRAGGWTSQKGGTMRNLSFMPVGKVYLTPGQKQARYIRQLERWVVALGITCVFLAADLGIAVIS